MIIARTAAQEWTVMKMTREEVLSVAKPILFNTEMVRAILDDRKTVTRRPIKPQPKFRLAYNFAGEGKGVKVGRWHYPDKNAYKYWGDTYKLPEDITDEDRIKFWVAPYRGDDILYVRENKWRPSIHMPKEAARIFLRVTNVRVEQLQDISGRGLIDEGLYSQKELSDGMMRDKFSAFEDFWNSTVKKSDLAKYGWDANPWVWIIEFEKVEVSE